MFWKPWHVVPNAIDHAKSRDLLPPVGTLASRRLAHAFGMQFWAMQPGPHEFHSLIPSLYIPLSEQLTDIAEILLLPEGNDFFCYPWMPFYWENEKLGNLMNFPHCVHFSPALLACGSSYHLKRNSHPTFQTSNLSMESAECINIHRRDNYRAGSANKRGCFIFLIPWRMR